MMVAVYPIWRELIRTNTLLHVSGLGLSIMGNYTNVICDLGHKITNRTVFNPDCKNVWRKCGCTNMICKWQQKFTNHTVVNTD